MRTSVDHDLEPRREHEQTNYELQYKIRTPTSVRWLFGTVRNNVSGSLPLF